MRTSPLPSWLIVGARRERSGHPAVVDDELVATGARRERRKPGHVRGDHERAERRRASHDRNTTTTVTSSHATTHNVHATTLAVIERVTASASGFGAPPFATTSLAIPHA